MDTHESLETRISIGFAARWHQLNRTLLVLNKPSLLFDASTEDFFKSMGQQFIEIAMGNLQGDSAVVQGWESQTALAQASRGHDEPVYENLWTETDYGGYYQQVQTGTRHVGGINDPLAGYTTEQRARAQGLWLGSNPDTGVHNSSQQKFVRILITGRYENNSCLRILDEGKGAFCLAETLGNAANQAQWRQEA